MMQHVVTEKKKTSFALICVIKGLETCVVSYNLYV